MALDKATVAHIARLARLRVEDEDLEPMALCALHDGGYIGNLLSYQIAAKLTTRRGLS